MKDGSGYLVFVFIIAEQPNLLWPLMIKGYSIVKPMGIPCRVFLKKQHIESYNYFNYSVWKNFGVGVSPKHPY